MERLNFVIALLAFFLVLVPGCSWKAVNNGQKEDPDGQKAIQAFVARIKFSREQSEYLSRTG